MAPEFNRIFSYNEIKTWRDSYYSLLPIFSLDFLENLLQYLENTKDVKKPGENYFFYLDDFFNRIENGIKIIIDKNTYLEESNILDVFKNNPIVSMIRNQDNNLNSLLVTLFKLVSLNNVSRPNNERKLNTQSKQNHALEFLIKSIRRFRRITTKDIDSLNNYIDLLKAEVFQINELRSLYNWLNDLQIDKNPKNEFDEDGKSNTIKLIIDLMRKTRDFIKNNEEIGEKI
jgi:hypothetical protein